MEISITIDAPWRLNQTELDNSFVKLGFGFPWYGILLSELISYAYPIVIKEIVQNNPIRFKTRSVISIRTIITSAKYQPHNSLP